MEVEGVDECVVGGLVTGAGSGAPSGVEEAEVANSPASPPSPTVFHYIGEARKGAPSPTPHPAEEQGKAEGEQASAQGQQAEGAAPVSPWAAEEIASGQPSKESAEAAVAAGEEEPGAEGDSALPHCVSAPACCSEEGAGREAQRHPSAKPQMATATSKAEENATRAAQSAAAAAAIASEMWEKLNAKLSDIAGVKMAAEYFNVSPMVVTSSVILGFLGFLLFGLGGQLVCTVVGALYPAFESFKVVEGGDAKLMEFWLNYWVVYAMISSVEYVGYYILAWLPFYYPLKLGFLLWLVTPSTGGVRYMYRWFISPVLHRNRKSIDLVLEQSSMKLKTGIKSAAKGALETGLGSAKGAGTLGLSKLKLGMQLVRPSVGFAMEAALSAARNRSFSNLAAAGGEKEKQTEQLAQGEPAKDEKEEKVSDSQQPLLKGQEEDPLQPTAAATLATADSEPEPELEDEKVARSAEDPTGDPQQEEVTAAGAAVLVAA